MIFFSRQSHAIITEKMWEGKSLMDEKTFQGMIIHNIFKFSLEKNHLFLDILILISYKRESIIIIIVFFSKMSCHNFLLVLLYCTQYIIP